MHKSLERGTMHQVRTMAASGRNRLFDRGIQKRSQRCGDSDRVERKFDEFYATLHAHEVAENALLRKGVATRMCSTQEI
jgi:hypothetical protein